MILLAGLLVSGCSHKVVGSPVSMPERPKPLRFEDGVPVFRDTDVALYGVRLETALRQCNANFK